MAKKDKQTQVELGKPDEVFSYGPITVARFGKYIQLTNDATPEQHTEILKETRKAHEKIKTEMEVEVVRLQKLISVYDPIELLNRAAYEVLPLFLKYRSESEFSAMESFSLPTLEYIQYLVARSPRASSIEELNEANFNEIWKKTLEFMKLTEAYLTTRPPSNVPPTPLDSIIISLDLRRLIVRVKRYAVFLAEYIETALKPYESELIKTYGANVKEIVEGIEIISEYQKYGLTGRYKDLINANNELEAALKKADFEVGENATDENKAKLIEALANEFKDQHDAVIQNNTLALTPALFEITNLTKLPNAVLSLLSIRPGEAVQLKLTGDDKQDLSPLSTSIQHYKPFVEVDGKYYAFLHSGFEDRMSEIIEEDLVTRYPEQLPRLEKLKSDSAESISAELLGQLISPDFSMQNVYYPNPDRGGSPTEIDQIMYVGDVLFLIEVKSGGLSAAANRGAPLELKDTLKSTIIAGQKQSFRAHRYIQSLDTVPFFDEHGNELFRIMQNDFRKVMRIVITKEDLGWIGSDLAQLNELDSDLLEFMPWHVSLDDLKVIACLFKDSNIRFIHYLEQRLMAAGEERMMQHDEIEHVGLYNKLNVYSQLPVEGPAKVSFNASYMNDIDYYFAGLNSGKDLPPPAQEMPNRMKRLIAVLQGSTHILRFEVGSHVLNLDTFGRSQLDKILSILEKGGSDNRQITMRFLIDDLSLGLSFTIANDKNLKEEMKRSAAQKRQYKFHNWLVIQLEVTPEYTVKNISKVNSSDFTKAELEEAVELISKASLIEITKPVDKNSKCPCGSGKKYKQCHRKLKNRLMFK